MNYKLLIAFGAGALLASGIVYMAVKDDATPKAAPVPAAAPRLVPRPPATPVSATVTPQAAPEVPQPAPVREKPSPMPPPVRREKLVARNQSPPVMAPVVPAPAVVERQPDPPPAPPPIEAQIPSEPPRAVPPPEDVPPARYESEERLPHTVTIAAGTTLPVRIGETISASRNQVGDEFLATLDRPLVVDGFIIAERGSRLEGRVVQADPATRGTGTSHLGIELVKLSTSDGQRIRIRTEIYKKDAASSTGSDVAKVGAGTVLGAAIGAAAGGGKGAAIGAGAGAAAGAAGVMLTRGKAAEIPVETRLSFRIANPITITERLN